MARQIDETKPLSKSDRQWLADWGKFDTIARIDAAHGVELSDDEVSDRDAPAALEATIGHYKALLGSLNDLLAKHGLDASGDPVAALDSALTDAATRQAVGFADVGNSDEHGSEDGEGEDGLEDDYDEMTHDEFRDLLGSRELSKSGNKDELIARLREDDAD
jgi:hypothetical protein